MATQPPAFAWVPDLALALDEYIGPVSRPIVGVDGVEGAGKSFLAARLVDQIDGTVVALDRYVEDYRPNAPVPGRLGDLETALASVPPPVIVEGVCLLRVLERLGVRLAAHVYVKRVGPGGVWWDASLCEADLPPETLLERERAARRAIAEVEALFAEEEDAAQEGEDVPALTEAVLRYHVDYRPSRRAHLVFHRPAAD